MLNKLRCHAHFYVQTVQIQLRLLLGAVLSESTLFTLPQSVWIVLLNPDIPCFANSVDPDQLVNWSGSALFVIQYVNLYQQSGLSNMIGWQL